MTEKDMRQGVDTIEQKEARKVPPHESIERPWASNDKVQFDNLISHCKRVDGTMEVALSNLVSLQQKINDEYIARNQQIRSQENEMHKQRLEHLDEVQKQFLEHDTYKFGWLYEISNVEAVAKSIVLEALKSFIDKETTSK